MEAVIAVEPDVPVLPDLSNWPDEIKALDPLHCDLTCPVKVPDIVREYWEQHRAPEIAFSGGHATEPSKTDPRAYISTPVPEDYLAALKQYHREQDAWWEKYGKPTFEARVKENTLSIAEEIRIRSAIPCEEIVILTWERNDLNSAWKQTGTLPDDVLLVKMTYTDFEDNHYPGSGKCFAWPLSRPGIYPTRIGLARVEQQKQKDWKKIEIIQVSKYQPNLLTHEQDPATDPIHQTLLDKKNWTEEVIWPMMQASLILSDSIRPEEKERLTGEGICRKRAVKFIWVLQDAERKAKMHYGEKRKAKLRIPTRSCVDLISLSNLTPEEETMSLDEVREKWTDAPTKSRKKTRTCRAIESSERKVRHTPRHFKECEGCGRRFLPKRASQKFHSRKCSVQVATCRYRQILTQCDTEAAKAIPEAA